MDDEISGWYGDMPYCSPVESRIFFDTITSARIHRVSESMMSNGNSETYFMDKDSNFHNLLIQLKESNNENTNSFNIVNSLKIIDVIPPLLCTPPAQRIISENESRNCFFNIESVESRNIYNDPNFNNKNNSINYVIISLDLKGIDFMWQSLLSFLLGDSFPEKDIIYVLPGIDIFLKKGNSYGGLFFSLWALGVSSILHYFKSISIDSIQERLKRVSILITVLQGYEGDSVADEVHLFLENKLKVCVNRSINTEILLNKNNNDNLKANFLNEEWFENATEIVMSIHEELCDLYRDDEKEKESERSSLLHCILFIIPEIESTRKELEKLLCDSYTSTPIIVATEENHVREKLNSEERCGPITFFVSQRNLEEQLLKPEHERYLNQLSIDAIIHSGLGCYNNDIDIIRLILPKTPPLHNLSNSEFNSLNFKEKLSETNYLENGYLQEAINLILWLFRRFKLELCRKGIQPILHISESFFISRGASTLFENVMNFMQSYGLIKILKQSDGFNSFRLEVLGRAISYRFRLPYEPKFPEFTTFDIKCILWCYVFRQSIITAKKLIAATHFSPKWVDKAVDNFCLRYRISLENDISNERENLIQQLSLIPKNNEEFSRIKTFLTYPSGQRLPISKHFNSSLSTSCRGWFEQAPISINTEVSPKPHVNIYCYPSHSKLCELRFGDYTLQCPLDISYPLIATHIVIHTALWNNGVFLEYKDNAELASLIPIPSIVLQSPTFNSFLDNINFENVGFWLDNSLNSIPPISDASEFASLMSKIPSILGLCDHGNVRRKRIQGDSARKRPREEVKENFKIPSDAEVETIKEFAKAAKKLGREKAEKIFKETRGFGFLDPSHENHAYYLHVLNDPSL